MTGWVSKIRLISCIRIGSHLEYELVNSSEATTYKSYLIKNANLTNIHTYTLCKLYTCFYVKTDDLKTKCTITLVLFIVWT